MVEKFGTYQGQDVFAYTLTNAQGCQVKILNLAGIVQEFSLVKTDGSRENVVVHFDQIEDYYSNPYQVNKQIGRIAGRIATASFDLAGQHYQLKANHGKHLLHGGDGGLNQIFFDAHQSQKNQVILETSLTRETDGFPGDLQVIIRYELDDDNQLTIHYQAIAGKEPTVFDPTLHIYWALSEHLQDVQMQINSQVILETDLEQIPTGQKVAVQDSVYDFRQRKVMSGALQQLWQSRQSALDDAFEVEGDLTKPQACIWDSNKGYGVEIFSNRNGLVIFTANPLNQPEADRGMFNAIATEPQTLPDTLHHPEWGDVSLAPGQIKDYIMAFKVKQM